MFFRKLFSHARPAAVTHPSTPLRFFNTLGKSEQEFALAPHSTQVRMYNCGPTVYDRQHIGNLSAAVFGDTLRRALEYAGLPVKHVINITDFGHLTSDADAGDDKMAKGLLREGKAFTMENMLALGTRYRDVYFDDIRALNVATEKITFPRASEYVPAQVAMIETLMQKGYAYETSDGVYFETARFSDYGKLGNINLEGQLSGARVEEHVEKRGTHDFALWKKSVEMGWDSPWGKGFPGWHIECSAMIRSILGEQIDIHTGGIEHIAVHHNNEIAQTEAATGKKPFSRFWMHRAHIQIEGAKIAKSDGNVVYLSDVTEHGFHPLALRYLFLGAHYRTPANFSWEALAAAQTALVKLVAATAHHTQKAESDAVGAGTVSEKWQKKFAARVGDDLDTPGALAVVWEMMKDISLSPADLAATLADFDQVLGLRITDPDENMLALASAEIKIEIALADTPDDVQKLIAERETARSEKRWDAADALRAQISDAGYTLEDATSGVRVYEK